MIKTRMAVFLLLSFLPLEIVSPFAFQLALTTTTDSFSFLLSTLMLLGSGAVSIPWALMWVSIIRRLYNNMDAYLFDGNWIEVQVYDEHFENSKMSPKYLSFWQYLRLRLFDEIYLFTKKRGGDVGENRFYIVKCSSHNLYFLDYKHGFKEVFRCPKCSEKVLP